MFDRMLTHHEKIALDYLLQAARHIVLGSSVNECRTYAVEAVRHLECVHSEPRSTS